MEFPRSSPFLISFFESENYDRFIITILQSSSPKCLDTKNHR